MKKITILLFALTQIVSISTAQTVDSLVKIPSSRPIQILPNVTLYGNIRSDFYYNSRQMEEGSDGFVMIFPKQKITDNEGNDLNGHPMSGLTATGTRFGMNLSKLHIPKLNAEITGKIEADFQGFSSSATMLRIRHAWINLNFGNADLLIGQHWNPLYDNIAPAVLDLNGGHPYQPFARNPQIKYSHKLKNIHLWAAAAYQTQFMSSGPDANGVNSKSTAFIRNSLLPDAYAGVEFNSNSWRWGVAGEYKQLVPRTTANVNDEKIVVNEKIASYAVSGYGRFSQKSFHIGGKLTYGQNLSDLSMIGGYAVSDVNSKGEQSYKAFNTVAGWMDANYKFNEHWNLSVFGGYVKNLGCNDEIMGNVVYGNIMYGDKMLDQVWRASTMLSYQILCWKAALEYSYNQASYGTPDFQAGKARDISNIAGSRLLAVILYYF